VLAQRGEYGSCRYIPTIGRQKRPYFEWLVAPMTELETVALPAVFVFNLAPRAARPGRRASRTGAMNSKQNGELRA
jgi:hypothetical protein